MTTAQALETARHIRMLVGKGRLEDALAALHTFFSATGDKEHLNDVVALQARLYGLNQAIARGTVSEAEAGVQHGRICHSILLMLDVVAPEVVAPQASKPVKKGKLLHNIPGLMKVGEVIECRVRIATTEKQIRKNFTSADHIATIPLDRLGERMEVQLVAANPEAFIIKRQNKHSRQIIEPDVHTEWVFDVIPLMEGVHRLFLKVDIILEQKGAAVHRDEVISVPVDVSATQPTAAAAWQNAADISGKPGETGFFQRILGGIFPKDAGKARRFASVLVIAIAGFAIAQILFPPEESGYMPEQRSVGIVVESTSDSVAEVFTIAGKAFSLEKIGRGVWQTRINLPIDTIRYRLYFQGNKTGGHYRNSYLPGNIYTFRVVDTTQCGVLIGVNVVARHVENWRLSWGNGKGGFETIRVKPLDDTTFFAPLGNWCAFLFAPGSKHDFQLVNDSIRLYARDVEFGKPPYRLFFYNAPFPGMFRTGSDSTVTLLFNRPVRLRGVSVNGNAVKRYERIGSADARKSLGLRFALNPANIGGYDQTAKLLTFRVSSRDCNCIAKTLPASAHISDSIFCEPVLSPRGTRPVGAPAPVVYGPPTTIARKKNRTNVLLTIPPMWEDQIDDLSLWVNGDRYSEKLPVKNGKIPFDLAMRDDDCEICIKMKGLSGKFITLGCYDGPVNKDNLDLQFVNGRFESN